jgi:hypothetical protein
VCVGASDSTTASDDTSSSDLCVVCVGRFPRGVLGGSQGGQVCPSLVTHNTPIFFLFFFFSGGFCYF